MDMSTTRSDFYRVQQMLHRTWRTWTTWTWRSPTRTTWTGWTTTASSSRRCNAEAWSSQTSNRSSSTTTTTKPMDLIMDTGRQATPAITKEAEAMALDGREPHQQHSARLRRSGNMPPGNYGVKSWYSSRPDRSAEHYHQVTWPQGITWGKGSVEASDRLQTPQRRSILRPGSHRSQGALDVAGKGQATPSQNT